MCFKPYEPGSVGAILVIGQPIHCLIRLNRGLISMY